MSTTLFDPSEIKHLHVYEVPVVWLIKNLLSSVDRFSFMDPDGREHVAEWQRFLRLKGSGLSSVRLINDLSDGVEIDAPICVYRGRMYDLETPQVRGWHLGNGNHRLAVSILMGKETIKTVFDLYDGDYMHSSLTSHGSSYSDWYTIEGRDVNYTNSASDRMWLEDALWP